MLVGATAGCARDKPEPPAAPSPPAASAAPSPTAGPAPSADPAAAKAAALVATLADEVRVGQVLMPYAYGSDAVNVSAGCGSTWRPRPR